jgi:hypothetical protein
MHHEPVDIMGLTKLAAGGAQVPTGEPFGGTDGTGGDGRAMFRNRTK